MKTRSNSKSSLDESKVVKYLLIGTAVSFLMIMLVVPLITIFAEAFRKGVEAYFESFNDEYVLQAIKLTLITAVIAVPLNLVFGVCASWAIAKYSFFGKSFLITLIDLPFAVSPVISGFVYVLLFGAQGWFASWLIANDVQIIFAVPGIVLATIFVTFPFVARELIPLMQEQGNDEEQAALLLGASGFQTFWKVTLPNIKWGLLYGVILCNARAMGEFGAVSVPLQVEILYNEYNFVAAFAVSTLLAILALLTLVLKYILEWKVARELKKLKNEE
jgi:sulfate transport system permease protein